MIRVGKLFTIQQDSIIGEVGRVKDVKLSEVLAVLRRFFSL